MNTPVHPQIQRTLAAVVVTDAVSFSKHMSQDEDRALAMINRDLQLISELCEFFEGQVLKTVGDGVLMYFISAVQAAACAVEMQKTFAGFARNGKADEHFVHRVGVHLGDIFFNQQDMMGTGVNIAARLESAARPGAICMSQVVYDMVKSRLELDAIYAGELPLKNISEAVAAYHVWPKGIRPQESDGQSYGQSTGQSAEESSDETTEAIAPLAITPINAALKILTTHPNHRRIKKLLYGTHQAVWENDVAVLEAVPMKQLLESLTERNDSLTACRNSLYEIVGTLNRQEEYSQVAEVIIASLQPLYVELTSGQINGQINGQVSIREEVSVLLKNPVETLHQDIAELLDQTHETVGMKKMLYCLCYDSWENDSDRILAIPTVTLISELYRQVTTIQGLQNRLRAILLRLNRKTKYAPIANLIFEECQILYPEGDNQISMPGSVQIEDSVGDNTQIHTRKQKAQPWIAPQQSPNTTAGTPVLVRSAAFGS